MLATRNEEYEGESNLRVFVGEAMAAFGCDAVRSIPLLGLGVFVRRLRGASQTPHTVALPNTVRLPSVYC